MKIQIELTSAEEERIVIYCKEIRACQLKCVSFLFPLVFKGCSVDGADRYSGHF